MAMAEGGSQFVSKLDLNSTNVEASWKRFKSQFTIYHLAKDLGKKSDEEKIANMFLLMGSDVLPIYERFVFDNDANVKTYANVQKMFGVYVKPAKSVIFERLRFKKMSQAVGQPLHAFITEIMVQADECEYGGMRYDLVRDRIVVGVADDGLRDHLLSVEDLIFDVCIRKAKQYVSQREGVSHLKKYGGSDDNVDMVSARRSSNPSRLYSSNI